MTDTILEIIKIWGLHTEPLNWAMAKIAASLAFFRTHLNPIE